MLKIKLTPIGKRNHRLYRIVVANDHEKLTGPIVKQLGTYDPHSPANQVKIDQALYQSWCEKGAQPTPTVKALVAKTK
jgi:small subunit ribosomal protein S16